MMRWALDMFRLNKTDEMATFLDVYHSEEYFTESWVGLELDYNNFVFRVTMHLPAIHEAVQP